MRRDAKGVRPDAHAQIRRAVRGEERHAVGYEPRRSIFVAKRAFRANQGQQRRRQFVQLAQQRQPDLNEIATRAVDIPCDVKIDCGGKRLLRRRLVKAFHQHLIHLRGPPPLQRGNDGCSCCGGGFGLDPDDFRRPENFILAGPRLHFVHLSSRKRQGAARGEAPEEAVEDADDGDVAGRAELDHIAKTEAKLETLALGRIDAYPAAVGRMRDLRRGKAELDPFLVDAGEVGLGQLRRFRTRRQRPPVSAIWENRQRFSELEEAQSGVDVRDGPGGAKAAPALVAVHSVLARAPPSLVVARRPGGGGCDRELVAFVVEGEGGVEHAVQPGDGHAERPPVASETELSGVAVQLDADHVAGAEELAVGPDFGLVVPKSAIREVAPAVSVRSHVVLQRRFRSLHADENVLGAAPLDADLPAPHARAKADGGSAGVPLLVQTVRHRRTAVGEDQVRPARCRVQLVERLGGRRRGHERPRIDAAAGIKGTKSKLVA
mmetsp:Transcript_23746/g.80171  ORF Transcript_23746/g.80171 Transcript_23746/m.80171 type:complete len:491 (-) Transcript_23746:138-1610(-)